MSDDPQRDDVDREARSLGSLISDALMLLNRLFQGELALAKAEAAQALSSVKAGVVLGAIALIVVLVALTQFGASLAAGFVSLGLAPAWAHLSAAGVLLAVAVVLGFLARRKWSLRALTPERSLRNLEQDADAILHRQQKEGVSQ